jgi:TonB family protein
MKHLVRVLALLCMMAPYLFAQQESPAPTPALPTVTGFECPKYPPKAESMRLSGMVTLRVTTDGHSVTNVKVIASHPVLAEGAVKAVRTWKFADHAPTTFPVTFFYINGEKFKRDKQTGCDAKLELPSKVTVSSPF